MGREASSAHRAIFLAAVFLTLFVNFRWNLFGLQRERQAVNMTADDYILFPMKTYAEGPAKLRWLGNLVVEEGDGRVHPYVMMFGLQRIAFSALTPNSAAGVERAVPWLETLVATLLAAVFTAFVAVVRRELGMLAAAITAALLFLSNWLVMIGPSLVWVAATFFAPFVVAFLFGDPLRSRRQRQWLAAAFTLLCFGKFLCGYDYSTNICGAVAVPLLYYGLLRGQTLVAIAKRVAVYAALSVAAFVAAIGLQITQFWLVQPDFRGTVTYFFQEAHMRTSSGGEGISAHYDAAVLSALHALHAPAGLVAWAATNLPPLRPFLRYLHYLGMAAFSIPFPGGVLAVPIGILVAGVMLACWFLRKRLRAQARVSPKAAWLWATLLALGVSHFWAIAANGHMTHTFFNAIIFYIPFLPMAYAAVGFAAEAAWRLANNAQARHNREDSRLRGARDSV